MTAQRKGIVIATVSSIFLIVTISSRLLTVNSTLPVRLVNLMTSTYSMTNKKHWVPDWALNDNIAEVLENRRKGIMKR